MKPQVGPQVGAHLGPGPPLVLRDICREFYDLRLLLLLYGATNHWSGWVDGLARCITPVVADILSKDLDFRR